MTVAIEMGHTTAGAPATLDLEELLATRLLVQGNSGSGKSHLLRRLLEQSAPWVQQTIIDPEGDFVALTDRFGHLLIDAEDHTERGLQVAGERARIHRVSTVLNLEGLDAENQMRRAAAFLGGLFEVARDHWYPMLVVVDEAQLFAPAVAGEVSDEARKLSLGAMTNLMCRGRKRGLAGVIATQRLAKLAKNVAAEASNFLMGRTFLDIDMARAADLLGMERRQAEAFRDLERGQFMALGPALSRRPLGLRIGPTDTTPRNATPRLMPLPEATLDARAIILAAPPPENNRPQRRSSPDLLGQLMAAKSAAADPPRALPPRSARQRALRAAIFATFPYPARLRLLLGPLRAAQRTGADRLLRGKLAERLVPEAAAALRVAPGRPAGRRRPRGRLPEFVAARGQRRAVVGMLTGCVQQVFFPQVNLATARVLASEGCDVVIPASQGCCGALSLHDGRRSEAAAFARSLIETFESMPVSSIRARASR